MKLTDEQRLEFRKAVAEGYYDHTAVDRVVAIAEKLITEIVIECRTELLHPEFGSEWQEPNGAIWKAVQDARAEELRSAANAWTQGAWASTPRHREIAQDRIGAANYFGQWLRDRAAAIAKRGDSS